MGSFLVALVSLIAAVWDVRTRRVPNWLTFSAIGAGFVLGCFHGTAGVLKWLMGTAVGFLVLFVPYALIGGLGEGDVKLGAAFGALGGPGFAVWAVAYGAILGGVGAIVAVVRKIGLRGVVTDVKSLSLGIPAGSWSLSPAWREVFIPYAPFLSAGALLLLLVRGGVVS